MIAMFAELPPLPPSLDKFLILPLIEIHELHTNLFLNMQFFG